MNKDAILATLIGFGIGLLITGLLLVGPNVLKYVPAVPLPSFSFLHRQKTPDVTPTPTPKQVDLSIESPLADSIEDTATILVSGTARRGATVVIAGPGDESVILVNGDGKFAGKVTLQEGKNDITVTAIGSDKTFTQTVVVYYTEAST